MVTSYVVVTLVERSHLLNPCSSSISGFLLFTRVRTQIYRKYVCCWFRDTHKLGFTTTAEIPETVILWFLCLSTRRESEIGRPGPESAPALDIEREWVRMIERERETGYTEPRAIEHTREREREREEGSTVSKFRFKSALRCSIQPSERECVLHDCSA